MPARNSLRISASATQGDPEFGELNIRVLPRPHIEAKNIVVRFKGRRDLPPLIQIQSLSATSGVISLLLHHINHAHVEGLQIHVPPRDERDRRQDPAHIDQRISKFVVDEVVSDNAYLEIMLGQTGQGTAYRFRSSICGWVRSPWIAPPISTRR